MSPAISAAVFMTAASLAVVSIITYRRAVRMIRAGAEDLQHKRAEMEDILRKEADTLRKVALVEAREEAQRHRDDNEKENRGKRSELKLWERRLHQRETVFEKRMAVLEQREQDVKTRDDELTRLTRMAEEMIDKRRLDLEKVAGLTAEEGRAQLLQQIDIELRRETSRRIRQFEEEMSRESERRARRIVALAIQRCAVDQTVESTVSSVALPSDEMKGRIIGREGRNIRTFETLTGVDLIIDDTPECVVLSSFDPVRREVARLALVNLISDGRIHPVRIEESVARAREEVSVLMQEAGERALFETGVTGLHPDLVTILGKLRFRTSYGQNILEHSIEMAHLAGAMAAELGANALIAKRGALLHDIGKAIDFEVEGPHVEIGVDLCRRYGESAEVIHTVEAHHGDIETLTVEAVLVQCADSISSARPGARRETLENYVKRLQKLEAIARSIPGVENSYAVQAGREVRLMVKPETVDDAEAALLAHRTAKRIEEELQYPGHIKVTVIREVRAIDYAR